MSQPSATAADIHRQVDPKIWRACAGASVQIPSRSTRVYYFPQGHVEHCCVQSPLSSLPCSVSPVLCVVSSIELLADPITDEVFAHLWLKPIPPEQFTPNTVSRYGGYGGEEEDNKVATFAKILTPSDANNGGGFSVPRYCADSVFPPLNFQADPPVQTLSLTDIHGIVWDFRHIYRGTPRRHLLTTGWSKFVNSKKLIAGDSVVFMRKSVNEMFIGVRRAPISNIDQPSFDGDNDELGGYYPEDEPEEDDGAVKKGFRRTGKGLLTAEAVSEAINNAAKGLPFQVVFYPAAGWSDFVVKAEDVEASMSIYWTPGTRIKMAMETEDSSRITWFQGSISCTIQETGPWRGSPWKPLQITWDEPDILQNVKRVNPWQVEVVANPSQFQAAYPPTKRSKYPHTSGFYPSGEDGEILYPGRVLTNSTGDPNPPPYMLPYTTFPAGMQGARQYGFTGDNRPPPQRPSTTNSFYNQLPGLGNLSTDMANFGSSPSDDLSPNSNLSSGNRGGPAKTSSFQLFGKTISVHENNSESGSGLCEEEEGSKESSDDNEVANQTHLSLTHGPPQHL